MREGTVIFIDEKEFWHHNEPGKLVHGLSNQEIYKADLILCESKILKNRYGKTGVITEFSNKKQEEIYSLLVDIFDEMKEAKKIEEAR